MAKKPKRGKPIPPPAPIPEPIPPEEPPVIIIPNPTNPPIIGPNITLLSPNSGISGSNINIIGTGFGSIQGASTITMNGLAMTVNSWSNTNINAVIPNTTTGPIVVTVNGLSSSGAIFTVTGAIQGSFVSPSGSDSNPGTQSQPWRTLAFAATQQVSWVSRTLVLLPGIHLEDIPNSFSNGSSGNPYIIKGSDSVNRPLIKPNSLPNGRVMFLNGRSWLEFRDIIFDAANGSVSTFDVIKVQESGGTPSSNILFENIEIRNSPSTGAGAGILIAGNANGIILRRCQIHHNGTSGNTLHHGIYVSNAINTLVEDCDIYSNSGYGIHAYTVVAGGNAGTKVRRNLVHHNNPAGVNLSVGGIILRGGSGIECYNNILWETVSGIQLNFGSFTTGCKVYYNTIYNCSGIGIEVSASESGAQIFNNISYLNGTNYSNSSGSTSIGGNLFGINPLFVSPPSNFHLQSGSPAINIGTTVSVTDDYDKKTRVPPTDAGAFEF